MQGKTATSRGNKPSDRINPFLLCGSRAEEDHPGQLPSSATCRSLTGIPLWSPAGPLEGITAVC